MTKMVNSYVIPINEQKNALIEGVGAKLKCVYWITQHKDGGKGKNRPTLKTVGRGHGEIQQAADSRQRAGI